MRGETYKGAPCKHGHGFNRYVKNSACVVCRKLLAAKRQKSQRAYMLSTKYGLLEADYGQMVADQNGVCAVCANPPTKQYKNLVVDHCHKTGVVRGLLCSNCNTAIGLLQDSSAVAERVAAYINRVKWNPDNLL